MKRTVAFFTLLIWALGTVPYAMAQQTLLATTSMTSPKASISQTIGITEVEVGYSRPSVRDRKVWGGLIPFQTKGDEGLPWRAGANENTTLSLSTAAKINGTSVAAGTYGVHMYVYEDGEVSVMLSSNSASWGSYYYDKEEVVATLKTERTPCDFEEYLRFDFSDFGSGTAVLSLAWAEERIPLKIQVDVKGTTLTHLQSEMQSRHMINAIGPLEAATWCLQNDTNLVQALQWANYSISFNKMFENVKVKSQLLRALDKQEEADEALEEAMPLASVSDLYWYGLELAGKGEMEQAMKVANHSLKGNKTDWTANFGMARVYSAQGDLKKALYYVKKAEKYCEPERSKTYLEGQRLKLEKGEAI